MDEKLVRIARWLTKQPWNEPRSDKTWVLTSAEAFERWHEDVRNARRVKRR